jgi:dihydroorotate dehydrogenase electron transfer subunit
MKILNGEILANKKYGENLYKIEVFSPYICRNAAPAQFVEVKCSSDNINDPLLRRPFAICEIDKKFNVFSILYIVKGKGTSFLSTLRKGQYLDFIGPLGNGFLLEEAKSKYVLIGGGIGVAPLCYLASELSENGKDVFFIAGFKDNAFYAWEKDLAKITRNYKIFTEDGSFGDRGLPTSYISANIKDYNNSILVACGPLEMLKSIQGTVNRSSGVKAFALMEERMACGTGVCLGCVIKTRGEDGKISYKRVCSDGPAFNLVEVVFE